MENILSAIDFRVASGRGFQAGQGFKSFDCVPNFKLASSLYRVHGAGFGVQSQAEAR